MLLNACNFNICLNFPIFLKFLKSTLVEYQLVMQSMNTSPNIDTQILLLSVKLVNFP